MNSLPDTYDPCFSTTSVQLPWYGIRTRSNHEKIAATLLALKGYEYYLPLYRSRRRWSDRTVETERPLFPSYVFCKFDANSRLPVVSTPGVVSVVGFGAEPAPIPDAEVEAVRTILCSGLPAEPYPFMQEGQRVRVKRGALDGLEGILLKKKSSWRMVISVVMLQRSISVEIDSDWILAI